MKTIALRSALAALIALIALCLAWELRLAPLRPGGSWVALKALPLLLPLRGLLRGSRYTAQWSSMFILIWFCEGVVRAWSEAGLTRGLALAEVLIALAFQLSVIVYARQTAPSRQTAPPLTPAA
jgi:uncharacterized membrane protein